MYVDCFDPHEPWDPPLEYARRYDPAYEGLDGCIPPLTTATMTDQQVRNVRTAYAAEVTLVDAWIGHLLEVVEEKGLLGNTLIVFTSDHGCMLGEQGEIHKGADRLRNQCTRVPLFIRHPRGDAAGVRVTDFVQHQDIMPTVLALMGLDVGVTWAWDTGFRGCRPCRPERREHGSQVGRRYRGRANGKADVQQLNTVIAGPGHPPTPATPRLESLLWVPSHVGRAGWGGRTYRGRGRQPARRSGAGRSHASHRSRA
jgi:hypothetical protein